MSDPDSKSAAENESPWCFYSTDGDVLGPIERRHLETIWRAGQFPEDVVGFDPAKEVWCPLQEWFPGGKKVESDEAEKSLPEKKFRLPPPELAPLPPSRNQHGRSRKPGAKKILRWQMATILSILAAVLACVAMYVRANTAFAERDQLKVRVDTLRNDLQERTEALEKLSAASNEVLPPDELKGRLLLRAADGTEIPQAGVKVLLYNRRDIERHLDESLGKFPPGSDPAETIRHLVNHLPFPITTTTTDSHGFYDFRLQAPGEFVLHTNLLSTANGPMVWFLTLDSTKPPHTRIDFKESNRSTSLVPGLVFIPAR